MMAKRKYKKKPESWYGLQYTGGNVGEMTGFCYLCIYDSGQEKLLFNGMTVEPGNWILEDDAGIFTMMIDEQFNEHFTIYVSEQIVALVSVGRYDPRLITPIEAVTWNGDNFGEVQVVCPQASVVGSVVSIPGLPEVYVGEVVIRELSNGKFSKADSGLFKLLYESQLS